MPTLYRKGLTLRGYGGVFEPSERLVEAAGQALQLVAEGRLELGVGNRFPLAEAPEAFAALQSRKPGKILLDIGN
jgi:NADPH:quinone reductase-like Zn-dependent oxidoreductase